VLNTAHYAPLLLNHPRRNFHATSRAPYFDLDLGRTSSIPVSTFTDDFPKINYNDMSSFPCSPSVPGARIAQSVQHRITDWAAGVRFPEGTRDFFLFLNVHPPFQCVTVTISPGLKRTGREVDHSSPYAVAMNDGAIPPLHRYAWCLTD
jgi:hypothetical protein